MSEVSYSYATCHFQTQNCVLQEELDRKQECRKSVTTHVHRQCTISVCNVNVQISSSYIIHLDDLKDNQSRPIELADICALRSKLCDSARGRRSEFFS